MKNLFSSRLFLLLFLLSLALSAHSSVTDRAVRLDGRDNTLRMAMPFLTGQWTVEAWVRSDQNRRKALEYIVGGGEWNNLLEVDNAPLALRDGHLYATFPRLSDPQPLDSLWHHVALTCDGSQVVLYRDGQPVARRDTAYTILPGMFGSGATECTFTGDLDELRVWTVGLDAQTLQTWMGCPVSAAHPHYANLLGYYPMDDLDEEMAVNWTGRGFLPYHMRNGRREAYGQAPLAYTVPGENPHFRPYDGPQRLFNAVAVTSEWDCDAGSHQQQMVKLRIAVQGSQSPMQLTGLTLDLSETEQLSDVEAVHVYYTGQKAASTIRHPLFGGTFRPARRLRLSGEGITLQPGINYVLVTFDLSARAVQHHRLGAQIVRYELDGKSLVPETAPRTVTQEVTAGNALDADVLKVLQWNIWHGGLHVGNDGPDRVLQLVRHSAADVCLMQEAYGIQPRAHQLLPDYRQWTYSPKDNLCLFSRLPMTYPAAWREPFKSAPGVVTLRNGHRALVTDLWLRYATDPSYTDNYYDAGQDTRRWVRGDSLNALEDIRNIVEKDVLPYAQQDMSVILGGDFNSCSHLDWTERTARFHYGYGAVDFPVSRYLQNLGYTDTFRELYPDEMEHPEGTWANIFGHSRYCRIDFIYSKGALKPVRSKIVRTHPEIDFVWPSDHHGMMTVFRLQR